MHHTTIELPHVREDSCGTVHDTLELVCCRPRYASQEAVTIVDSCSDERVDKRCCWLVIEWTADLAQLEETLVTDIRDVLIEWQVWCDEYAKNTNAVGDVYVVTSQSQWDATIFQSRKLPVPNRKWSLISWVLRKLCNSCCRNMMVSWLVGVWHFQHKQAILCHGHFKYVSQGHWTNIQYKHYI